MANTTIVKKVLEHVDRDELIAKMILDIPSKDINEWLGFKYSSVSEKKLVLSEKAIKTFRENYLDIYALIRDDLRKTKVAISANPEADLNLVIQGSSAYKAKALECMNSELDVRQMVQRLCTVIEIRFGQIFDEIMEDPRSIDTKVERIWIEYGELLGNMLERFYKITEVPADITVQHNITVQMVDQHISVLHDVIRDVLSQMDLESSMFFMERFSEKMAKLKMPTPDAPQNTDVRLAEAKVLNETINQRLNA